MRGERVYNALSRRVDDRPRPPARHRNPRRGAVPRLTPQPPTRAPTHETFASRTSCRVHTSRRVNRMKKIVLLCVSLLVTSASSALAQSAVLTFGTGGYGDGELL